MGACLQIWLCKDLVTRQEGPLSVLVHCPHSQSLSSVTACLPAAGGLQVAQSPYKTSCHQFFLKVYQAGSVFPEKSDHSRCSGCSSLVSCWDLPELLAVCTASQGPGSLEALWRKKLFFSVLRHWNSVYRIPPRVSRTGCLLPSFSWNLWI